MYINVKLFTTGEYKALQFSIKIFLSSCGLFSEKFVVFVYVKNIYHYAKYFTV